MDSYQAYPVTSGRNQISGREYVLLAELAKQFISDELAYILINEAYFAFDLDKMSYDNVNMSEVRNTINIEAKLASQT